jgi:hypothetical protein
MVTKQVFQSAAALVLSLVVSNPAHADEGGLSFWLPGLTPFPRLALANP